MVSLQTGQTVLDTDGRTGVGLRYESEFLGDGVRSGVRSFEFSLPLTPLNGQALAYSGNEAAAGLRDGLPAALMVEDVRLEGRLYLIDVTDRYNVVFRSEVSTLPDVRLGTVGAFRDITLTVRAKTVVQGGDAIIAGGGFGWLQYANQGHTLGSADTGANVMEPAWSVGSVIKTACSELGLTFAESLETGEEGVDSLFVVVGKAAAQGDSHTATVSGSARGGWTVSGATWADLGLQEVGMRFKKGAFNANVSVKVMQALRPVKVVVPYQSPSAANPCVWFVQGEGYDVLCGNLDEPWGQVQAMKFEFSLNTGEYFAMVSQDNLTPGLFRHFWADYTSNVSMTLEVIEEGEGLAEGCTLALADNLPDMTLRELTDAAAAVLGRVAVYSSEGIALYSWQRYLQAVQLRDANGRVHRKMERLAHYIDGRARHNVAECTHKSTDGEREWFVRDEPCLNGVLEESAVLASVPFSEGGWIKGADGSKYIYIRNFQVPDGGEGKAGGEDTLCRWKAGTSYGSALHLQSLTDDGEGADLAAWSAEARTVGLTLRMTAGEFAGLGDLTCYRLSGRAYIVKTGSWSDGWATLILISL